MRRRSWRRSRARTACDRPRKPTPTAHSSRDQRRSGGHRGPGAAEGGGPAPAGRLPLRLYIGKEHAMDASSKLTSKGQVTVPKSVRDALGLEPGDSLLFRVEGGRALVSKTPDFL